MHTCRPSFVGLLNPLVVLGIVLGAVGFASLTAALVDPGDHQRPVDGNSSPVHLDEIPPAFVHRARVTGVVVESSGRRARGLERAVPERDESDAPNRPQVATARTDPGPGEREIFLNGSAAVAHRRVWVQEYVATPPAVDFQMIGATSPYP